MVKLSIIHYSPPELYPPLQNLLLELEKRKGSFEVVVLTTNSTLDLSVFGSKSPRFKILRFGKSDKNAGIMTRLFNYVYFYSASILTLLMRRPERILYFETLSSFPAYLYKRFVRPGVEVFIHYHEYTSKDEYRFGMKLARYFHQREKWLIPRAAWVSQTNTLRMEKFRADLDPVQIKHPFIMPNYPPRDWVTEPKLNLQLPLRIVYVGSVGLESTYVTEFAKWVVNQKGKVHWDIYSFNCTAEARELLQSLRSEWITLKKGVDYKDLAAVLSGYDVGVILYSGHIPNYVYNAPNKLFEYLMAGLAVWFPAVMLGSLPYRTERSYPEVVSLDFTTLDHMDVSKMISRTGFERRLPSFFCDEAVGPLLNKILA